MKKYISRIIISIILLITYYAPSYCVETGSLRMQINNGPVWTNITISESYEECASLNSTTSTLGTTNLKAHLTTDADWSAMAIFSVSQYGGATANAPSTTNGNATGIYGVGTTTQTTGIVKGTTSGTYTSGLFNSDGTLKEYIREWDTSDRNGTGFVGFMDAGTCGWLGSNFMYWGTRTDRPISLKNGLFGGSIGHHINGNGTAGERSDSMTFRPVVWN